MGSGGLLPRFQYAGLDIRMGSRHMKNLRIHHLAILIAMSFTAQSASATSAHVLLCFPGGPGSTEQAQPIVDEFLAHLAVLAGWDNVNGSYINNMRECRAAMKTDTPATVVMVPLDLYLAEEIMEAPCQCIATEQGDSGRLSRSRSSWYHARRPAR